MKNLVKLSLAAFAAAALVAAPVSAQSRGGSSTRSSAPSSASRSAGSSASRSSGSVSRSSSSATRSTSAAPARSSSSTVSRQSSASSVSRSSGTQSSASRQTATRQSSTGTKSSATRSSGSVSSSQTQTRSNTVTNKGLGTTSSAARSNAAASSRAADGKTATSAAPANTAKTSVSTERSNVRTNSAAVKAPNNGINPHGGNTPGSNPQSVRNNADKQPANYNGGRAPREVRLGDNRNVERIAPRDREPMPFNRPARFWDGGHHYFGYRVTYLPPRHVVHHYWGRPYYFCDGLWYRFYIDHYYVCRPPFGYAFVPDVVDIVYATCRFAYYHEVYQTYRTVNENAQTIAEQNRIIAQNNAIIAQQNADIALNTEKAREAYEAANNLGLVQAYADASVEYFYDDGVFFTKNANGQYTVIVPPAGALVSELPDDYDTITINGKEYYKVDDTIFELTIVDGSAYFQILGQLTGELADRYDLNK